MKYFGINLRKYVQDLYIKIWKIKLYGKLKSSQRQSREDLNKWRNIPCSRIIIFNIANMSILNDLQIQFNPSQIPVGCFWNLISRFSNLFGNTKNLEQPNNLKMKKRLRNLYYPISRLTMNLLVMKTSVTLA